MVNKIFFITLLAFLWTFVTFWSFNHINSWVGIGLGVLGVYISAKLILKIKNKLK
jgi:hypothetical protein